jgi:hypothetical protein
MTGELIALAALHGRAGHHVGERAIVLEKIQINRCQVLHRMAPMAVMAAKSGSNLPH